MRGRGDRVTTGPSRSGLDSGVGLGKRHAASPDHRGCAPDREGLDDARGGGWFAIALWKGRGVAEREVVSAEVTAAETNGPFGRPHRSTSRRGLLASQASPATSESRRKVD